jgi:hypothetical protein
MSAKRKCATEQELQEIENEMQMQPWLAARGLHLNVHATGIIAVPLRNAAARVAALHAARKRVGSSPFARLSWLLDLANDSLPATVDDGIRISAEISAFLGSHRETIGAVKCIESPPMGTEKELRFVRRMHTHVRRVISDLVRGKGWDLHLGKLKNCVFHATLGCRSYRGSGEALFNLGLWELFTSSDALRLRRCAGPNCARYFLKRKRGLFCSDRCRIDKKLERYHAQPVELRSERRHQVYKNSVRKDSPARANRVTRRGPRSAVQATENQAPEVYNG